MEEDAQAFIEELERRREAPISWRTYATWYGNNRSIFREFGVFLYRCKDTFHFEDFERTPSMFGISLKPKKKLEPFIKYENSFSINDVDFTRPIPKTIAFKATQGSIELTAIRQASLLDKAFRQMVEMVVLKDGTVHFFELMDRKKFVNELQKRNEEE